MSLTTFDTAFVNASDLPQLRDFQADLANIPGCIGIWNMDSSAWTLDGNGAVQSVANLRAGGLPLVQANAAQRPAYSYDSRLGRETALFTRPTSSNGTGQNLVLSGFNWQSQLNWSIVAVAAPLFITDFQLIGGEWNGSNDFAGLSQINLAGRNYGFVNTIQDQSAATEGRNGFNRLIAASGLGNAKLPKLNVNRGLTVTGTGGAQSNPTGQTFSVSHPILTFGGAIDCALLFNFDILGDPSSLALVHAYLDERYQGLV